MKVAALMLCFASICLGQTIPEKVKRFEKPKDYAVEYDKFKKRTVVQFSNYFDGGKGGTLKFSAVVVVPDDAPPIFYLHFRNLSRWRHLFTSREPLRILADGELLTMEAVSTGYEATFPVLPSTMAKIVASKTVELQLSKFEGKWGESTLVKLKNLYSLAHP